MDEKFEFDHSNEISLYSDVAEINVTQDSVTLSFALRSNDNKKAKVSHKVYLSIPHFFKFADVCNNMRNQMVHDIQKAVESQEKIKKG